jgi:hypothetical protein
MLCGVAMLGELPRVLREEEGVDQVAIDCVVVLAMFCLKGTTQESLSGPLLVKLCTEV